MGQLHSHREQHLQLLHRGPLDLGDKEEAEVAQASLLELGGAVLGAVAWPQQREVPVLGQQLPAEQRLCQARLHRIQLPLHCREQVHLPQVEHQRLPIPMGALMRAGQGLAWCPPAMHLPASPERPQQSQSDSLRPQVLGVHSIHVVGVLVAQEGGCLARRVDDKRPPGSSCRVTIGLAHPGSPLPRQH